MSQKIETRFHCEYCGRESYEPGDRKKGKFCETCDEWVEASPDKQLAMELNESEDEESDGISSGT